MRDFTLGQYYPVDSVVHRLDARSKILLTIAYIVAVFMAGNLIAYIPILAFVLLAARLSKVPGKMLIKARPLRILLIFTFVLNLFLELGSTFYLSLVLNNKDEGLSNAIHFTLRLIFLCPTSLLTLPLLRSAYRWH